jgi:L,D-peptidoglycan transpeptidase YkuD (ErfK/YbiS/YcfS/YnhG family)
MKNDWRITTGDGRISLRVPSDFNASVDASTGDGTVRVDGIDRPRSGDESERRRVVGQLGSGGATLHLRSGDGSIDVTR